MDELMESHRNKGYPLAGPDANRKRRSLKAEVRDRPGRFANDGLNSRVAALY
jgi:hypothetical protein